MQDEEPMTLCFLNVYGDDGKAVILALPVAMGGHYAVLMRHRMQNPGVEDMGYALFQTRALAESASSR